MPLLDSPTPKVLDLLQSDTSLEKIFDESKPQLLRTISSRIGLELGQRVSPSDVLQEAFITASKRLESCSELPDMQMIPWLHGICSQVISIFYKRHFKTSKRSIERERSYSGGTYFTVEMEIDSATSPSGCMIRAEERRQIMMLLDKMSTSDREILKLRHISTLTNQEAAEEIGISAEAAKKRHTRAIKRLADLADNEVSPFDFD